MFGLNLAGTRGNTVRQKPDRVVMDYVTVPKIFWNLQKFVTIAADVMFLNGAPFLMAISRGVKFATAKKYKPVQLSSWLKIKNELWKPILEVAW